MVGFEYLKSVGGGGRYDALASDGRNTYPGVGISFGISRTLVPLISRGLLTSDRTVPSAVLVALNDEESRAASDAIAQRAARARRPCEVAASAAEVRQADPVRRAAGHPVRLVPGRRRRATRSRTSAAGSRSTPTRRPGAPRRRPRTRRLDRLGHRARKQRGAEAVIRTHDAGTLAPSTSARPSPSPAGWPGAATTAASPSSTCARPPASCRSSSATRPSRTTCAASTASRSPARCQRRPEGNENPNLPTGEIEVIADDVEVLSAARAAAVPDRRPRRGGEEARLAHRYLDLRRSGPRRGAAAAQRGQPGGPRRARTATTSSRSRRPR